MSFMSNFGRDPLRSIVSTQNDLIEKLNELSRQAAAGQQKSEIEAMKELYSAQYAESSRYASVVMVAGYAAFFAMWNSVRNDLSKPIVLWAGLLMTISVILFVGFEVAKMSLTSIANKRIIAAVSQARHPRPSAIHALTRAEADKMFKLWKWTLLPTLITGFGAAGLLVAGFVRSLAIWYFQR